MNLPVRKYLRSCYHEYKQGEIRQNIKLKDMKANKLLPLIKHYGEKHKKLVEEVHEK